MQVYTNLTDYASAQPTWLPGELVTENYGRDAATAGNVRRMADGSWMILDGSYRPANVLETDGIEHSMVKMAEALAFFAGYEDIEAMQMTLASYDAVEGIDDDAWHAWLDQMADDWADTYDSVRFGFALI